MNNSSVDKGEEQAARTERFDVRGAGVALVRQETVVLLVDLVESVRLMREHEAFTVRRWADFVRIVTTEILPHHRGVMVKSLGDGLMARFEAVPDAVDAAVDMPYDIPNFQVEYVRKEPPAVPTGFWRGVGPNNNVFAVECFMDELAHKAGKDPVEFRRSMLASKPRFLAVLNQAAEKANWGQPLPPRVGRGVCVQPSFASFIATVVEAEIDEHGEVLLRRVTSVVDTGIAINPDTVMAQIEGGLIFGLTAALYGEITIDKGRVQQSNFHDYRMLRIDQAPKIEVHVIKSGEAPGGIGETGVTAGPPALRNAIYAATGVALRRLPIDRSLIAVGRKA